MEAARTRRRRPDSEGPEELTPRTESRDTADFVAASEGDRGAPYGGFLGQIIGQGGLADAGLTTKEDEAAMTGECRGQLLAQEDLLPLPADDHWARLTEGGSGLPKACVLSHGEPRAGATPRCGDNLGDYVGHLRYRGVPPNCAADGERSKTLATLHPGSV